MGDIAESIIDGIFCQQCGAYIDDEESKEGGPGYPRNCSDCDEQ